MPYINNYPFFILFSFIYDSTRCPSIVCLLFVCSPPAVLFAVVPIVIDSLNCSILFSIYFTMFYVAIIHIIIEIFKIISQHLNSSSSITYPVSLFCRIASPFYSMKYFIELCSCHSMSTRIWFFSTRL